MIKRDKEGFYFISKNGIRYELLEGVSIGSEKQFTSDIIFIALLDPEYNVSDQVVGFLWGASFLEEQQASYAESIAERVAEFEKKNFNL